MEFLKRISGKLIWKTPEFELELTPEQESTLKKKGVKIPAEGDSVAIGAGAFAEEQGVAIGKDAYAGRGSVSIGTGAGGGGRKRK